MSYVCSCLSLWNRGDSNTRRCDGSYNSAVVSGRYTVSCVLLMTLRKFACLKTAIRDTATSLTPVPVSVSESLLLPRTKLLTCRTWIRRLAPSNFYITMYALLFASIEENCSTLATAFIASTTAAPASPEYGCFLHQKYSDEGLRLRPSCSHNQQDCPGLDLLAFLVHNRITRCRHLLSDL